MLTVVRTGNGLCAAFETMSYLRSRPELIVRFQNGERDALAEVYRAYLPRIRDILRRGFILKRTRCHVPGLSTQDDLADALQEVFTRAFKREARQAYDGQREYSAYLRVVARNVVITRYRKQGRELITADPLMLDDAEVIEPGRDAEQPWHDFRALEIARSYVSTLDEPMRAVHAARYVDALSQRDAARELGNVATESCASSKTECAVVSCGVLIAGRTVRKQLPRTGVPTPRTTKVRHGRADHEPARPAARGWRAERAGSRGDLRARLRDGRARDDATVRGARPVRGAAELGSRGADAGAGAIHGGAEPTGLTARGGAAAGVGGAPVLEMQLRRWARSRHVHCRPSSCSWCRVARGAGYLAALRRAARCRG